MRSAPQNYAHRRPVDCVWAFRTGKPRAVAQAQIEAALLNRVKTLLNGAEVIGLCQ